MCAKLLLLDPQWEKFEFRQSPGTIPGPVHGFFHPAMDNVSAKSV